eukprot:scaffold108699_cov60-Phaeocystis_antarctica.AAC.1
MRPDEVAPLVAACEELCRCPLAGAGPVGGLTAQALLVPSDPRGGRSRGSAVSWPLRGEVLWSGRQRRAGRPAAAGRAGCRAGEQQRRGVVGPMLGPDRWQLRRLPDPLRGRRRDHGCGLPTGVGCGRPG